MAGRWRPGTVPGNDGRPVKVWRRGDWIIAQDVNVGALSGERRDRWGFTLARVMRNGDEVPVDVLTDYGTATWDTRREAAACADTRPPLLDHRAVRARADAAHAAALNARVRRLERMLRADPSDRAPSPHRATEPDDAIADLAALAEYVGARRTGVDAVAAALLFICESGVRVEDHGDGIVLTFDEGCPWSRDVALAWPITERRWTRELERADDACTTARERAEERS